MLDALLRRLLALIVVPAGFLSAQGVRQDSGAIARSLVIRAPGVGVLLPVGENGALHLGLGASGNVTAMSMSGDFGPVIPPRSVFDVGLEAGYLHFAPTAERLRGYRYGRVGYGQRRFKPNPVEPIHTVMAAAGFGALAQVTARFGVMADLGMSWRVSRHRQNIGINETVQTTTAWQLVSTIGVTLRAKPSAKSSPSPSP